MSEMTNNIFSDSLKPIGQLANGIAKGFDLDTAAVICVKDNQAMVCFGCQGKTSTEEKSAMMRKVGEYMLKMCDRVDQGEVTVVDMEKVQLETFAPTPDKEEKDKPKKKDKKNTFSFDDLFGGN